MDSLESMLLLSGSNAKLHDTGSHPLVVRGHVSETLSAYSQPDKFFGSACIAGSLEWRIFSTQLNFPKFLS
ncbi:MAG: hypothetical protein WBN88_04340 [Anderseniella sp.]